jgi:hypothetical protein
MSNNPDYEEGVRDTRLKVLEESHSGIAIRMDNHERRLVLVERIIYGMVGVLFLSSIWPKMAIMLDAIAGR